MKIEKIKIFDLLENNFKHILFELKNDSPFFFRVTREYHHALYRIMVELFMHSAMPINKGINFNKFVYNGLEIHKIKIPECEKAWRYSQPKIKKGVENKNLTNTNINQYIANHLNRKKNRYLLDFYSLLALIQTDYFSVFYNSCRKIEISNEEMNKFEFLHETVRNEFEHFGLDLYYHKVNEHIMLSKLCSKIIKELIFESENNVSRTLPENIKQLIVYCDKLLDKICN